MKSEAHRREAMENMKEKFPAPEYTETVLSHCFEDAKRYFLEALIDVDYAHAIMLAEQNIITEAELKMLLKALNSIDKDKIRQTSYDGSFEDLFYLLQREVRENCEDSSVAGKLHTARSRNDIDVTIYRMKLREYLLHLTGSVIKLRENLLSLAERYKDAPMPAYTHTQPAQPTTLGHFLLAMVENLRRDTLRLIRSFENANLCPLGSGAITTSGFPINRFRTAELLGFDAPTRNSYASIGSVDYFTEAIGAVAVLMINIGKFAQEFLLMAMQEFDVIRLSDGFVQGSSIMPQKRNPVALEHVRAISSKALGQALGVMTAVHNTPFGDINDVEDDLQPLIFNAMQDACRSVDLLAATLKNATFNVERLKERANENFITVTELADELVRRERISFKEAHEIVGKSVRMALSEGSEITLGILQRAFQETLGRDIQIDEQELKKILSAEHFIEVRRVYGGTAPDELSDALFSEKQQLETDRALLAEKIAKLDKANRELKQVVTQKLENNST